MCASELNGLESFFQGFSRRIQVCLKRTQHHTTAYMLALHHLVMKHFVHALSNGVTFRNVKIIQRFELKPSKIFELTKKDSSNKKSIFLKKIGIFKQIISSVKNRFIWNKSFPIEKSFTLKKSIQISVFEMKIRLCYRRENSDIFQKSWFLLNVRTLKETK